MVLAVITKLYLATQSEDISHRGMSLMGDKINVDNYIK